MIKMKRSLKDIRTISKKKMDTLTKNLCNVVSQAVQDFTKVLSEKYNIPISELQDVWNNRVGDEITTLKKAKAPKKEATESKSATCSYVFTKGDNSGKTCTSKAVGDTNTCKKHSDQKSKPKKEPAKKKKEEEEEEPPVLKSKSKKLVIKRNKDGLFEHTPTGLVIDEKTKEVYGKYVNGVVQELTVEDLEMCKKYDLNARVPKNLKVDKQADSDPEDELEDEEEEEEEDERSDDE